MAPKSITHHDVNASSELELSTLAWWQLIQQVANLWRQLGELRAQADRERKLVAIHHDTIERDKKR